MAITVKHTKVSTIPDGDDTSVVRPSDWNADHQLTGTIPVDNGGTGASTLTGYVKGNGTSAMTASATVPNTDVTGLGTMSTQNSNNISVTGGSMSGVTVTGYIPTTEKGVALGVATLDSAGTVPVSQLPAAVLGALNYQGTWNASTNTPTLTSSVGTKGYYYVVSVAGSTNLNGVTDWQVGDWAVYNGTAWQKIDNTDSVTSVNGYTGAVVLTNTDISGFGTMSTQNANGVAITGGAIDGTTIGATTTSTGKFTTLNASTSLTTPAIQATNSGGLSLKNSAGTTQISMGGGGGDNVSINVATNINGSNAQIDISPTGTGHVHMKPTGTGSIEIAPTNVGTIDNMTIGATTPKAITGTTITATSFVGSGASLTNVVNSLAASTGISVSGSTGAVTVTNTAPDQTVSLTAGTGISTSGTYPNFTITNTAPSSGGTVTSVTGTAPVVSSGGNTPAISMAAANTSTNGYLTSTDWNTFNGKGNGSVTSVAATVPSFLSVSGSPITTSGTLALTYSGTALPVANGGTGQTSYTDGQLLIGNTSGNTLTKATLTAGSGISVTNAGGAITIASTVSSTAWQSVQTSNFTAVAGNGYPVNTTSTAITVTFPASPSAGNIIILTDYAGTWNTKNVTINPNGNKIISETANLLLQNQRESVSFVYIDSTQGWLPYSGFQDAIPVSTTYTASYLAVAGGGGGVSGGGGAGGYRTSTASLNAGTTYTITVGGGGSAGSNGSDSVISGSGLSTITSVGGGAGTSAGNNGASGGSGGGGAASGSGTTTGGSGTSGQGNAGGGNAGFTAGPYPSGGGGGAGATGANAVNSTTSGAGGNGSASSITGSSVTYAGGGGGATYIVGNPSGAGGTGGGGAGNGAGTGTAGTANTGGGGGGSYSAGTGGAGGSGVVILSVPTSRYSGTTTGSPSVTTSGSNTILTYNSSGSYTA